MKQRHIVQWPGWTSSAILILGIVGFALGLRIWGIWFGLPFIFHNDEDLEVVRALQLGSGSFDFTRIYKGGYFYLLFFEYGILFVVLTLSGVVSSTADFALYYFRDPSAFYLVGRATTASIGALTVYLTYRIGRLAYSERVGLFAATLLAVNILHAKLSHFITVDVPAACLATATVYFAIKIAMGGERRDYIFAAVLAALATTTKVTAILLIIPLCLSHYFNASGCVAEQRRYIFSKPLWQAIATFIVVYVVTTPGIVVNFAGFAGFMLRKFGIDNNLSSAVVAEVIASESKFANTNLFVFYLEAVKDSMAWPVFLVCLAGIGYGLWNRSRVDLVLITMAVTFYLVLSIAADPKEFYPRYMLPAIPAITLLGGRFLEWVIGYVRSERRGVAAVTLLIFLAIVPVSRIAADNAMFTSKDTRAIANEWFEANIPAGSRVFIEGTRTRVVESTIPLKNSPDNIRKMIEFYRKAEPGKAKYFSIVVKGLEEPTYDLLLVSWPDLEDLQTYKDAGAEYFVVRPRNYKGSRRAYEWPKLVDQLRNDPQISMIKSFDPDPDPESGDGPYRGPYIEIYRLQRNPE